MELPLDSSLISRPTSENLPAAMHYDVVCVTCSLATTHRSRWYHLQHLAHWIICFEKLAGILQVQYTWMVVHIPAFFWFSLPIFLVGKGENVSVERQM